MRPVRYLLPFFTALALHAQFLPNPTITRVDAFLPGTAAPGGAAVTVLPNTSPGFTMVVTGTQFLNASNQPGFIQIDGPTGTWVVDTAVANATGTTLTADIPGIVVALAGQYTINVGFSLPVVSPRGNAPFTVNPLMTANTLPGGTVGSPYSQRLIAGGTGPYAITTVSGTLPPNLAIDPQTGTLSGTPNTAGVFNFTLRFADAFFTLDQQALTAAFSVAVTNALTIVTTTLPNGTTGVPYTATLDAAGGGGIYTWSLVPPAPAGFTITSGARTGTPAQLSGTPAAAGTLTFNVRVADANTNFTRTLTASIQDPLSITTVSLPNGTAGSAYARQLTAAGGSTPYTWSPSPGSALPVWLTLNAATGTLSGTPPAAGVFAVNVTVTDALQRTASAQFTLTVSPPLSILSTSPLSRGTVGTAYSSTLNATGGVTPYAWAITVGSLPTGLSLTPATGAIAGTPSAAGTFTFTAVVTDAGQGSANRAFTIAVDPPLAITTATLPTATQNAPFSTTVAASGGFPSYSWSATGLPAWLSLNATTGVLSGTPPAVGTVTFTVTVLDSNNRTASGQLSLVIVPPLVITSGSPLPVGIAGVAYAYTFAATGGVTPYTWSSTTLPTGLTLSAAGVLSGIPRQPGPYTFDVTVAAPGVPSATRTFALTVNPSNLTVVSSSLPEAILGSAYSTALTATGATPPYTWSIAAGGLPAGFQLAANGAIGGIATATGTYNFTVQVADTTGQTATRSLFIDVVRPIAGLSISTTFLPNGTVGEPYNFTLGATGGETPYSWLVNGLPAGLAGGTAGAITGTPTAPGTFSVTAEVRDRAGRSASATFQLIIAQRPLTITTSSPLANGTVGSAYSATFAATGGKLPYSWSMSGAPAGLTLSPAGSLTGTPVTDGTYTLSVQVTDADTTKAAKAFQLTIGLAPLTIATLSPLPGGTLGRPYSAGLTASGGLQPYRWSASGLPSGLAVDAGTGAITGTPGASGTFSVAARVTDSKGAEAARTLELTISGPGLSITTASPLANGTVGTAYSGRMAAGGGVPPYRWAMPAGWGGGITVASDGTLGGTPTDPGDYTMYIEVTDSEGKVATKPFAVTIDMPALAISTAALPSGMVGAAYAASFGATGNVGPLRWSADGLPAGLAMSGEGRLSGTPAAPGSFTVTVRATDEAGRTATRAYTLTVGLPSPPAVTFSGITPIVNPAQQPVVGIGLTGTYPVPITGRVTLTFAPEVGGDDPAVQFSTGGRSANFSIPAGANLAAFTVPNLGLQTGTVAGVITLTVSLNAAGTDITPAPAPASTLRINRMPPVITDARVNRTANGFEILITGYTTTREATQAIFRFNAAAGVTLQTTDLTVAVEPLFTGWFSNTASNAFGSRFTFTQPFNVAGSVTDIASVTITLVNRVGNSATVTVNP